MRYRKKCRALGMRSSDSCDGLPLTRPIWIIAHIDFAETLSSDTLPVESTELTDSCADMFGSVFMSRRSERVDSHQCITAHSGLSVSLDARIHFPLIRTIQPVLGTAEREVPRFPGAAKRILYVPGERQKRSARNDSGRA